MKLKPTFILLLQQHQSSSALHFSHIACSNKEGPQTPSTHLSLESRSPGQSCCSTLIFQVRVFLVHVVAIFVESTKTIALPLHSPELELALPLHSPELESIHHVSSKLRKVWKRSRSQQQCIEPRVCCQGYGHCILPILT